MFADRYERRSVLVANNLTFSQWGSVFRGDRTTAVLPDWPTYGYEIFEMNGESCRFREFMKARTVEEP